MSLSNTVFILGFWLLIAVATIRTGQYVKTHGTTNAPFGWYSDLTYWRRQVKRWGLASDEDTIEKYTDELMSDWGKIGYVGLLYAGRAIIVTILLFCLLWLLNGRLFFLNIWLYWLGFILSTLLGQGIGYIVGTYRIRAATRQAIRYGDLRVRDLHDYRSNFWLLLSCAFVTFICLVTYVQAPVVGPHLKLPWYGMVADVPETLYTLWLGPLLLVVVLIVGEVVMWNIAHLPRLFIASNPTLAQRIDDMLRAKILTTIQGMTLYSLAFLSICQIAMLSNNFQSISASLVLIATGCVLLVGLLGIILPTLLDGRIGGSVTLWPWQHREVLQ